MWGRRVSAGVAAVVSSFVCLGAEAGPGAAAEQAVGTSPRKEGPRIYVAGPAALAVVRAFQGARRKLEDPRCQELLTDFTDTEGRSLRERLGGETPTAYLEKLVVRDG